MAPREIDMSAAETMDEKALLILLVQNTNALCMKIDAQNGRIGKLEEWRAWLTGGLAVLGVAFGAVFTYVMGRV